MISVGLDFASFWAFLIFVLNFIPVIGSIVATIFPALLALIQFDTIGPFIVVAGGVQLVQTVVGQVVEPKLLGDTLNLSPLAIILSLTIWGAIWGVTGMLLCVPITVIVMIVLAHFRETRVVAVWLSAKGTLEVES
jgi:predicted PurR-regulated permease PerM